MVENFCCRIFMLIKQKCNDMRHLICHHFDDLPIARNNQSLWGVSSWIQPSTLLNQAFEPSESSFDSCFVARNISSVVTKGLNAELKPSVRIFSIMNCIIISLNIVLVLAKYFEAIDCKIKVYEVLISLALTSEVLPLYQIMSWWNEVKRKPGWLNSVFQVIFL